MTIYGYSGGRLSLDEIVQKIYNNLEDPTLEAATNALLGLDVATGITSDMTVEEVEIFLAEFSQRFNDYKAGAKGKKAAPPETPLGDVLEGNGDEDDDAGTIDVEAPDVPD